MSGSTLLTFVIGVLVGWLAVPIVLGMFRGRGAAG